MHGGIGAGDGAGHRNHKAQRKLGDGDGVGARRIHDDDAAMGGGRDVDVVDAYTGAADDAELRRGLQQLGIDLNGGADDQGIGVGQFGGEAVLNLVVGDYVPARLLLEDGKGGRRDFFCENDLHVAATPHECGKR